MPEIQIIWLQLKNISGKTLSKNFNNTETNTIFGTVAKNKDKLVTEPS
jgi:hypothetical protein